MSVVAMDTLIHPKKTVSTIQSTKALTNLYINNNYVMFCVQFSIILVIEIYIFINNYHLKYKLQLFVFIH